MTHIPCHRSCVCAYVIKALSYRVHISIAICYVLNVVTSVQADCEIIWTVPHTASATYGAYLGSRGDLVHLMGHCRMHWDHQSLLRSHCIRIRWNYRQTVGQRLERRTCRRHSRLLPVKWKGHSIRFIMIGRPIYLIKRSEK